MAVTVFGRFKGGSCGVGAKGWTREGERIEHCVCRVLSFIRLAKLFWLSEAEFVLGSCDSVWPRAVVQRGRGAPTDRGLVPSNSLGVLRLKCMIPAG